jgi:hypothetical protein
MTAITSPIATKAFTGDSQIKTSHGIALPRADAPIQIHHAEAAIPFRNMSYKVNIIFLFQTNEDRKYKNNIFSATGADLQSSPLPVLHSRIWTSQICASYCIASSWPRFAFRDFHTRNNSPRRLGTTSAKSAFG